jgi:hypothetical protein
MDECRFDNWTRMVSGLRNRRSALKELAGAGAALVALARADLGIAAEDDVLVEGCRLTDERCKRNNNCCSNKCNRKKRKKKKRDEGGGNNKKRDKKGDGQCQCLGNGKKCTKDAACCRGRCDVNDRKCRCVPANDTCNKDTDCCSGRKCVANGGNKVCKNR